MNWPSMKVVTLFGSNCLKYWTRLSKEEMDAELTSSQAKLSMDFVHVTHRRPHEAR